MKFGLFMLTHAPDGGPEATVYQNALDLAQLADGLGFEAVWLAEHHFSSYGYTPNPLMFAVKVASVTERVRIGTAVVVVPLYHPLRLAENISFADHLTGGRLEVGFGRGYQQYEFQRFETDLDANRQHFDEGLEIISKALTQEEFSHHGSVYTVPETTLFPRPLQQPHPPFWIAAQSPDNIAATVRRGFRCITGGSSAPTGRIVANWESFRDAVDESGAGWPQEFAVQAQVYVSESEEDAREQLENALWHFRMVDALRNNSQKVIKGAALEERLVEEPDPDVMYDEWLLFGTPETVSRKLQRLLDLTGITYLNCVFSIGRLPQDKVLRSMNLFANEVMPGFCDKVGRQSPAAAQQPSSLG